ncbi:MAG: MFS transporter, partial [Chlamydiia bacterium]|nr:MFS transporter [Chlamydiia bacterium]
MTPSLATILRDNPSSRAFILVRLLAIPFWGLFHLLPVILLKEFGVAPFMIALLTAIKPMSALIAPYWSHAVHQHHEKIVANIFWAHLLKFIPFLFFPWVESPIWILVAFALFMILNRGTIPAWMEFLRQNVPGLSQEKTFAFSSAIDYIGTALIPLSFGWLLDTTPDAWRWLFPLTALIGLFSAFLLPKEKLFQRPVTWQKHPLHPFKSALSLLKQRSDFLHFQIGFMLGGAGLMLMHPALPQLFVNTFQLSYTEMLLALCFCKGVGFAFSSPAWVKLFHRLPIFPFSALVTLFAALFPLILFSGHIHIAYILYGIMQAGSEMS